MLGYEISEPVFQPVLELASKGERGWKQPIFLCSLITDPSPLLLHERWLFDEAAVKKALSTLKSNGVQGTEKLEYVFEKSKRFEPVEVEKLLNTCDDVDRILDTMHICKEVEFSEVTEPLGKAYGHYAWPNNLQFERMNAGIIRTLSVKFPHLTPLDDTLRAPVYEYLELEAHRTHRVDQQMLKRLALASRPPLPIPRFDRDWAPHEFVKTHKSKGADQLREIVHDLRACRELSDRDIERLIDRAKAASESLAGSRHVVYAFAGLGAAALSAMQAVTNPLLYVPSAVFAVIAVDQVCTTLESFMKAGRHRWLSVAQQIAEWMD